MFQSALTFRDYSGRCPPSGLKKDLKNHDSRRFRFDKQFANSCPHPVFAVHDSVNRYSALGANAAATGFPRAATDAARHRPQCGPHLQMAASLLLRAARPEVCRQPPCFPNRVYVKCDMFARERLALACVCDLCWFPSQHRLAGGDGFVETTDAG